MNVLPEVIAASVVHGPLEIEPEAAAAAAAAAQRDEAARANLSDRPHVLVRGWHARRRVPPAWLSISPAADAPERPAAVAAGGEYERRGRVYVRVRPADGAVAVYTPDGPDDGQWTLEVPDSEEPAVIAAHVPPSESLRSARLGRWLFYFSQEPISAQAAPVSPPLPAGAAPRRSRARSRRSVAALSESRRRSHAGPPDKQAQQRPEQQQQQQQPPRSGAQLWALLRQKTLRRKAAPEPDQGGADNGAAQFAQGQKGVARVIRTRRRRRSQLPAPQPPHGPELPAPQAFEQLQAYQVMCEEYYQPEPVRPRRHQSVCHEGAVAGRRHTMQAGAARLATTLMDTIQAQCGNAARRALPLSATPANSRPASAPPTRGSRGSARRSLAALASPPREHPREALLRRLRYQPSGSWEPPPEATPRVDAEKDCRLGLCDWSFLDIDCPEKIRSTAPRFACTEGAARTQMLAAKRRRQGPQAEPAISLGALGVLTARLSSRLSKARGNIERRKERERTGGSAKLTVIAAKDERYAFTPLTEQEEQVRRLYQQYLAGDQTIDFNLIAAIADGRRKLAKTNTQGESGRRYHCAAVRLQGNLLTTCDGIGEVLRARCIASAARIAHLDLSGNLLTELSADLLESLPALTTLHLHNNLIAKPDGLLALAEAPGITNLTAHGNPLEKESRKTYRQLVFMLLPEVRCLDFVRLVPADRHEREELRRAPPAWLERVLRKGGLQRLLPPPRPRPPPAPLQY